MSTTLKNIIFVVILIALMAGGAYWYFTVKPQPILPSTATSTPYTGIVTTAHQTPAKPVHITDSGKYYDIDIQYPGSTSIPSPGGDTAVQTMESFVVAAIADFKTQSNFANLTPEDIHMIGFDQGEKYSFTGDYATYTSPTTISYVFTLTQDTLGAHPNSAITTFTFDIKTGKAVQLENIFVPGSTYLQQLSTLSRAALQKKLGSTSDMLAFIQPGTTPDASHFKNFAFDGSNFIIFFDPYSVAPYSAGPQKVEIPLSQLSSVLNPGFK
jgi:hypothetical protein